LYGKIKVIKEILRESGNKQSTRQNGIYHLSEDDQIWAPCFKIGEKDQVKVKNSILSGINLAC
jgi:hypothetical protein